MATLKLNRVRLAFPQLWEPKQVNGEGTPSYSAVFILPYDHPVLDELEALVREAAVAKWGAKAQQTLSQLKAKGVLPVHDGREKSEYAGFDGNLYISARSKKEPMVVSHDKRALTQREGLNLMYPGCYVNAIVDIWAQDNQYGKRINAGLVAVQFAGHGEQLAGGARASVDDFEEIDISDGGGPFETAPAPAPAPGRVVESLW